MKVNLIPVVITVLWSLLVSATLSTPTSTASEYQRNQAVPVQQVLFGKVLSSRRITEREIREDQANGWQVFGGALIGGAIGYQFGDGSGQAIATILGSVLGAAAADSNHSRQQERVLHLVELNIRIDDGSEYMVIQDFDRRMVFSAGDAIRMIYLANGSVRIDKQL
ncbi:glycine zipper 2TM domain-containing protein [Thalassotalea euphylliae]|uniref:Glycine zipper 2TM domain-containing protein n=2 Tax=Thalassotalea euphylliae TaxID=1655234 RepID=A0A3E0TY12_9GAMM|nr:glycine zipper 2TM domain-containing protein [Thalassotalea euphylliae]